jgi:hypothetical protein
LKCSGAPSTPSPAAGAPQAATHQAQPMSGPTQARSPRPSRPIRAGLPPPRARPGLRRSPAPARLGFRAKHGKLRAYKASPPRASHACRLPRLCAPAASALRPALPARSPPPWPPPGCRRFIAWGTVGAKN